MEIKEAIELFFIVVTGIATTGTFLFNFLDRKPKCEIRFRVHTGQIGLVDIPELRVTVTNTGRTDLFVESVWILSEKYKNGFFVDLSSGSGISKGILLAPKRRLRKQVFLDKVLDSLGTEALEQQEIQLWVEVYTEIGKVYHSKKLSLSPEQVDQALKGSVRR